MAREAARHKTARLLHANDVNPEMLLSAAGYIFVCPENLASMSGSMKEMFDRNYYDVLGKIEGKPYASIIAAGSDGEGAQRQLDRIATGLRLKRIADPFIANFSAQTKDEILAKKHIGRDVSHSCCEIGLTMGEGIVMGLY